MLKINHNYLCRKGFSVEVLDWCQENLPAVTEWQPTLINIYKYLISNKNMVPGLYHDNPNNNSIHLPTAPFIGAQYEINSVMEESAGTLHGQTVLVSHTVCLLVQWHSGSCQHLHTSITKQLSEHLLCSGYYLYIVI